MKKRKLIKKFLKDIKGIELNCPEKLLDALAELKPFALKKWWCTVHLAFYNPITGEWISEKCFTECSYCADRTEVHHDNCECYYENQ